jgi:hypothetical protein
MEIPSVLIADEKRLAQAIGRTVEIEIEGQQICVIARRAFLPERVYTKAESDVLLITDFQYPMSAMDMFYTEPDVQPASGPIPPHASSIEPHAGRQWRRWSWHRNGIWKPGVDDLLTHWAFVEAYWAQETRP